MWAFIVFYLVIMADLVLTNKGISMGLLKEGNVLINFLSDLTGLEIHFMIAAFKITSVYLAGWLIFKAPKRLEDSHTRQKVYFRFLLRKRMTEKIVLGLTVIYVLFAVIPAYFVNFESSLINKIYSRILIY